MLRALLESIIHTNPPIIVGTAAAITAWMARGAVRQRVRAVLVVCGGIEAFIGVVLASLMLTKPSAEGHEQAELYPPNSSSGQCFRAAKVPSVPLNYY